MFIAQPVKSIGEQLNQDFQSGVWARAHIASAWVRQSGVSAVRDSIRKFLGANGDLQIVAGVDFSNTTVEGLDGLVALEAFGQARSFVYCNEAGGVFHPKVYLFSDGSRYRLYVGSANLTGAGLYSNSEAMLRFEGNTGDATFKAVSSAFVSWSDQNSGLSKQLTPALISELHAKRYIQTEENARKTRSANDAASQKIKGIFGSAPIPKAPTGNPSHNTAIAPPVLTASASAGNEFWIETGALTGGSGNQLDLSMVSHHGRIPGSISFFKVNPTHVSVTSKVVVRYNGTDYYDNSIKYPKTVSGKTNGTWRLQLNGKSTAGQKLTQHCGVFKGKILRFRDLGQAHFEIVAVDSKTNLQKIISQSSIWDTNRGKGGRHFGRI